MQRIDPGYLYELGDGVRAIRPYRFKTSADYEIWEALNRSKQAVTVFLNGSVFSQSIRGVHSLANQFLQESDKILSLISVEQTTSIAPATLVELFEAYDRFEPAFANALSSQITYLVMPKGAYDVETLVENGGSLFPASLQYKVPEASMDIVEGAKALAFELWSAAAFHFHRANEAVLRRYFDKTVGPNKRKEHATMGMLLSEMEKQNKGTRQVVVALQNIKTFHRNPNAHPGDFISDADEAFSLVSALRAAMGYMLDELEATSLDDMMHV